MHMEIPWGDCGLVQHLFEPNWTSLKDGDRISVVVDIDSWSDQVGLGRTIPGKQVVRLRGDVPYATCGFPRLSLLGVCAFRCDSVMDLWFDSSSDVFCHPPMEFGDILHSAEVCAGMACSSIGLKHVGFVPKVAVELQPKMAMLHEMIHPGVKTILGDVADQQVWVHIWKTCPALGCLMAGFACQPYSRAGSMGGALDSRAATLPAILQMAHFLQIKVLILECVVPARTNGWVRQHLRCLREELGYNIHDATFRLEDVWASCRFRWWVVATHPSLGQVPLPAMPSGSALDVRALLPFVREWPEHELRQLQLTEEEIRAFTMTGKTLRSYAVQKDQKLPTALHSWGNQSVPCACECRSQGLSDALLSSKGVFAQLMPWKHEGEVIWRHLHPKEVAILTGVPPEQNWSADMRLNLCAVGQQASPLQAAWVGACVLKHIRSVLCLPAAANPVDCLNTLKAVVLAQANQLYPPVVRCEHVVMDVYMDDATAPVQIKCALGTDVAMLLNAEARLRADDVTLVAMHVDDGIPLPTDHVVSAKPLKVCVPWVPDSSLSTAAPPLVSLADEPGFEPCPSTLLQTSMPEHVVASIPALCDAGGDVSMGADLVPNTIPVDLMTLRQPVSQSCYTQDFVDLTPSQLVTLLPPVVQTLHASTVARNCTVSVDLRGKILANQSHIMADDEIVWHLCQLAVRVGCTDLVVLDPLVASGLVASTFTENLVFGPAITKVITVIFDAGHWIPCAWTRRSDHLSVQIWDTDDIDLDFLLPLHAKMCGFLQVPNFAVSTERRTFGKTHCGAAAVGYLTSLLTEIDKPRSDDELSLLHLQLQHAFVHTLQSKSEVPRPWIWGAGQDPLQVLAALLQLHGVPPAHASNRAKLAMQSIGREVVTSAVMGVTPWKSLKQAANQLSPPFQLVLADELSQKIRTQEGQAKAKKSRSSGKTKGPWTLPTEIDPAKLQIASGTFRYGQNVVANHIPMTGVNPLAVGVALTTVSEAQHFLQTSKLLTASGLALLILNHDGDLPTQLAWNTVRFAATCTANGEPVLLHGHLVQLGQMPVYLYRTDDALDIPDVPVTSCRLTIHRDQYEQPWDDFCRHPVKTALSLLPPLVTCRQENCQCPHWHPTDKCPTDAVLDVFRRHFTTETGKTVTADKGSQYHVMLRYLKCQEEAVLSLSGSVGGLFVEPRSEDGTTASLDFHRWCGYQTLTSLRSNTMPNVRCRALELLVMDPGLASAFVLSISVRCFNR